MPPTRPFSAVATHRRSGAKWASRDGCIGKSGRPSDRQHPVGEVHCRSGERRESALPISDGEGDFALKARSSRVARRGAGVLWSSTGRAGLLGQSARIQPLAISGSGRQIHRPSRFIYPPLYSRFPRFSSPDSRDEVTVCIPRVLQLLARGRCQTDSPDGHPARTPAHRPRSSTT